jgi:hypothetical protein
MAEGTVIRNKWLSYRAAVIPLNAPPIQVDECRHAFYAGAAALFFTALNRLDPTSEVTPADIQMVSGVYDELMEFVLNAAKGAA